MLCQKKLKKQVRFSGGVGERVEFLGLQLLTKPEESAAACIGGFATMKHKEQA